MDISLSGTTVYVLYLYLTLCHCCYGIKITRCGYIRFHLIFSCLVLLPRQYTIGIFLDLLHLTAKLCHHLHGDIHISFRTSCSCQTNRQSFMAHDTAQKQGAQKLAALINIQVYHRRFLWRS